MASDNQAVHQTTRRGWLMSSSAYDPGHRVPLVSYLPEQPTAEQRERARQSALFRRGDMRLVWVAESDLATLHMQGEAVSYGKQD